MSMRQAGLFCVALGCAVSALATEVVVKNDSVTDFAQAAVVGDFAPTDHAGVRLTSPCDGRIVAVQILWWSQTGGGTQSIEEAIRIYANAGTFPTPGALLVEMLGPVLTPGGMNEFREIDENHTPLSIPVTAGQSFFVTLEFYNATNVQAGTPSVTEDTNGCQSQRNVIRDGFWFDFCWFGPIGDFVIRAVVDCQDPTGACCLPNGICQDEVEQQACAEYGAVWSQGLTCAQVTCAARGACCTGGGCLTLVQPAQCAAIGGTYAGDGSNCAANVCAQGACCQPDGSCSMLIKYQCGSAGGAFLGAGTSCTPNNCPQPAGACCFVNVCIPDQYQGDCVASGGVWKGAGSGCTPNPCAQPCVCRGDANCDNVVSWRDIDYFIAGLNDNQNAWQALFPFPGPGCTFANLDANNDAHVTWRDIDPFIAVLNTTCPCK